MLKRKGRIVLLAVFASVAAGVASTVAAAGGQAKSEAAGSKLVAMLEKSGYSYTKLGENVWEIQFRGKNFKEFGVRIARADDVVVVMAMMAPRKNLAIKEALLVKLLELNDHFDTAKLALDDQMLYARIDIHERLIDDQELKYLIEQISNVADEAYPHIRPFITEVK